MHDIGEPRIETAERMRQGVLIEFSDGKSALFPASFLYTYQPWYALDLTETDDAAPELREGE